MKRFIIGILAAAALTAAQPAMANDPEDYMYVVPESLELDADGVGTVTVCLNTKVDEYNSFMMDLYLPEGFTIVKNRQGKYAFTWNNDEDEGSVVDHSMNSGDRPDGAIRMLGTSVSASYIYPGDNWLFKFKIQAPEGFDSEAPATFKKIEFAEGIKSVHYFDDVEFWIRANGVPSSVADVTYDYDGEEVIYNLQGIRVQRPLVPGYYIINGQKQLIK